MVDSKPRWNAEKTCEVNLCLIEGLIESEDCSNGSFVQRLRLISLSGSPLKDARPAHGQGWRLQTIERVTQERDNESVPACGCFHHIGDSRIHHTDGPEDGHLSTSELTFLKAACRTPLSGSLACTIT